MHVPRTFRGRRSQDGAAAVEFALLFPIFAMLTFGMITGGITFSQYVNLTQAAREASRYGATLSFNAAGGTESQWLQAVQAAAIAAAGSDLHSNVSSRYICVAYVGGSSPTQSLTIGTGGPASNQPCFTETPAISGARVQVVVSRSSAISGLLFTYHPTVGGQSVTPYEASTS